MPTLSRGKHRTPRRGACFMELASFLAGERWSDHPACTHPLLATTARLINDNTPDSDRQLLAPLIPSVIGLTGASPRWDVMIARRAAAVAVPVVSEQRQRALAVALLTTQHLLDQLDGRPAGTIDDIAGDALARAPLAWRWAERFSTGQRIGLNGFRRRAAPAIVATSVAGITEACVADPSSILRRLLSDAIADCAALVDRPGTQAPAAELVAV
jgi:hypothetical protein